MTLEDKEAEIIRQEAKKDDESELHSEWENKSLFKVNPFEYDEVRAVLVEKDDIIAEKEVKIEELSAYFNSVGQIDKHPEYLKLKAQNDQLILENAELMETVRKLMKENPGSTFKPAVELKGSLGQ